MKVKERISDRIWLVFVHVFVALVVLLMTLPFINILALSFSGETAVIQGRVTFWPIDFTLNTYERVFTESQILLALRNTVWLTLVGTVINVVLTVLAAYPLAKRRLKGRNVFLALITFTMIFYAGIIPHYINIKNLKLLDSFWSLWLSGALSTYNMIILKTFFQSLPESLEESAQIDGASPIRILVQIVLPLSKAALATIALFYAVGWWNSYFNNMLYINKAELTTLQIRLKELLSLTNSNLFQNADASEQNKIVEESVKAVSIVIATVPILIVYPFLQKYFVKGVMIGAVKG